MAMTKDEYLKWLQTRGAAGTWAYKDCREANALIKQETLTVVETKLQNIITDKTVRKFTLLMIKLHFGSVEVDELCMALHAYPDWMEVNPL